MSQIEIEQDGIVYAAEYFCDDNEVSVIGNEKIEVIILNGMREINAAKTGLRNLIRQGKAFSKEELD